MTLANEWPLLILVVGYAVFMNILAYGIKRDIERNSKNPEKDLKNLATFLSVP